MDNPFQIKPVRTILQGDKELAASYYGETKRILFQLRNIQKMSPFTQELTKRYEDGTIINVHSKVKGMDVVTIFSDKLNKYPREREEFEKLLDSFPIPVIGYGDVLLTDDNYDTQPIIGGYVAKNFVGFDNEMLEINDEHPYFEYSYKNESPEKRFRLVKLDQVQISFMDNDDNSSEYVGDAYSVRYIITTGTTPQNFSWEATSTVSFYIEALDRTLSLVTNQQIEITGVLYPLYPDDEYTPYASRWTFDYTYNQSGYDYVRHDSVKYIDNDNNIRYICLYCYCDVLVNASGSYELLRTNASELFVITMPPETLSISGHKGYVNIKIQTDEDNFDLHLDEITFEDNLPAYQMMCAIFDFNGEPVYMYKLFYLKPNIRYTEDRELNDIVFEYGFIYQRKLHRMKLLSPDAYLGLDWSYFNTHDFRNATYIDPDGKEESFEYPDEIKNFFGEGFLWMGDDRSSLRASYYEIEEIRKKVL